MDSAAGRNPLWSTKLCQLSCFRSGIIFFCHHNWTQPLLWLYNNNNIHLFFFLVLISSWSNAVGCNSLPEFERRWWFLACSWSPDDEERSTNRIFTSRYRKLGVSSPATDRISRFIVSYIRWIHRIREIVYMPQSAGYPLISYFTKPHLSRLGGFNIGGTNASGQVCLWLQDCQQYFLSYKQPWR